MFTYIDCPFANNGIKIGPFYLQKFDYFLIYQIFDEVWRFLIDIIPLNIKFLSIKKFLIFTYILNFNL
jgi:hypothetical protein